MPIKFLAMGSHHRFMIVVSDGLKSAGERWNVVPGRLADRVTDLDWWSTIYSCNLRFLINVR